MSMGRTLMDACICKPEAQIQRDDEYYEGSNDNDHKMEGG